MDHDDRHPVDIQHTHSILLQYEMSHQYSAAPAALMSDTETIGSDDDGEGFVGAGFSPTKAPTSGGAAAPRPAATTIGGKMTYSSIPNSGGATFLQSNPQTAQAASTIRFDTLDEPVWATIVCLPSRGIVYNLLDYLLTICTTANLLRNGISSTFGPS